MRTRSQRALSNNFFIVLIVGLAITAGVFALLYLNASKKIQAYDSAKLFESISGIDNPAPKVLDPKFKDANADLVADPPTNPADFVNPDTLQFSYVAENPEDFRQVWKGFTDHLEKTTGKKVEYALHATTDEQIRAFADGKLHITGLNTGSVPISVNLTGFVPAYTLGTPTGGGYLHSEIIVPADSPIQKIEDLKGHTLAFVDANSNSGYKAPLIVLKTKFNMIPERDYEIVFTFGHDKSITGIANKTYEAAAVASDVLARDIASKKIKPSDFRSIYASENFPAVAFGYAHNLDPKLVENIRKAFDTFEFKGSSAEGRFAPSQEDHFRPCNYKTDFTLVRFIDDQIGKPYKLKPVSIPSTEPAATETAPAETAPASTQQK
jgi:phosphonate transport system substrate-binding protein